jgi:hypothetical protein
MGIMTIDATEFPRTLAVALRHRQTDGLEAGECRVAWADLLRTGPGWVAMTLAAESQELVSFPSVGTERK